MKIKSDFVTNSSSSSFVLMGNMINKENITNEYFEKMYEKLKEKYPDITLEEIKDEFGEMVDHLLQGTGLTYSYGPDYDRDDIAVGIPYTDMGDDETLAQMKERARSQIYEIFGIDEDVTHLEECWMDT